MQQLSGRSMELIVDTPRQGRLDLRVVDVRGRCVGRATSQVLRVGPNRVQVDFGGKAPGKGIHFVVLKQGKEKEVFKMMRM